MAPIPALLLALLLGPGPGPEAADEAVLRNMKEVLWPRAYREGDVALLDRILAREFQMVDPDGGWSNKQKELDHVSRNRAQYRSFRFEIRRLEVFENGTAVVAGRGVVVGPPSDPEGGYEYQSSNVLIKRDGRWQAIASHVSGVRPLPAAGLASGRVDHHVHILGDDLLRDWKALGVTFSRPVEAYRSARAVLDSDTQRRAVLVPMAHLYGNQEFRAGIGLSLEEERARVARENDHVAQEAARYPGRAVAFCSVSALRPYAREELLRCHEKLASAGVKLHLASSGVDLRDAGHLAALAAIAGWAEREQLPILLHLDPQLRGTDAADVEQFARTVLEPHPRLSVIVAHLGGSGGYGPWTRSVFRTLSGWLEKGRLAGQPRPTVLFDLSAVVLEEASEGVPATTPEEAALLAADLRSIGLDRLVLGSDYPVFDPGRSAAALARLAGLTPAQLEAVAARTLPGLFEGPAAPPN